MPQKHAASSDHEDIPRELIEPLLTEISLSGGRQRLIEALTQHARTHDLLMRIRSVTLQYSPTYVEPLTALRWIESGGHSVD